MMFIDQFFAQVVAKETQTLEKRETNTTVVISVTDVNDNAPLFTQSVYEFSVAESPSFPVFVGTVSYFLSDFTSNTSGTITIATIMKKTFYSSTNR